jgi:hypothetical protein
MNRHQDLLDACDGYFHRSELKWKEGEPYTPTIYFLTRNNKIVYIGESGKPLHRFKQHTAKHYGVIKEWDRVYFKSFDTYVLGIHLRHLESRAMTYLNEATEYNAMWRLVGDKNENPFNQKNLEEFLTLTKNEVEQWRREKDEERMRKQEELMIEWLRIQVLV